jgi:23S rRNA (uracil1939-C5)-methyltransferase
VTCRHSAICGGCSLQHLSHREQLVAKEAVLRQGVPWAIGEAGDRQLGPLFVPLYEAGGEPWHFRQKVAFAFGAGPRGRGLVMGHYERGSRRVVAVEECAVHSIRGNRIAFALRDHLSRAGIGAAGGGPHAGVLRHLIVRTTGDDREAVAMLVVTRNDKALRRPVRALLESAERPDGFFINVHDAPGPFMVGPVTIRIDGRSHVRETVGGFAYLVSPTAFFQTNVRGAAALQRLVLEGIGRAGRVLDLYCGSGLFTLPLAAGGSRVVAVEENRRAIQDAAANLRLNRIPPGQVRLLAARVEDALPRLDREAWDAVVLDPPRQGCAPGVIARVFQKIRPARAVYVSCHPEALAAELPAVHASGYRVDRIRAVDMFPHTEHIETVVSLVRV